MLRCVVCRSLSLFGYSLSKDAAVCQCFVVCYSVLQRVAVRYNVQSHPGTKNNRKDLGSAFLGSHWWSQHPACQLCFYKPLRNGHHIQRVSTPPVESLTLDKEDRFLKTDFRWGGPICETDFWYKEDTNPVSRNHQEPAQIAASGFLKHSEETGQIADCSVSMAVFMSRDATVIRT